MKHPTPRLPLSIAILLLTTACGVQKEYRVVPTGNQTRIDVQEQLAAPEAQRADLLARAGDGEPLQVRLSQPLSCERTGLMQVEQVRLEERSLSTGGKVAMWSGYAGAAAVVGLFGTGIANGSDPRSGLTIMAVYGLPLAGLGVGQSLAARDREHPAPPTTEEVALERAACQEPDQGWQVQLRRDGDTATLHVGTDWKAVDTDAREILATADRPIQGMAEAAWPLAMEAEVVYAQVDDTLDTHIAAQIAQSPAQSPTESPVPAEPAEEPAPADKAEQAAKDVEDVEDVKEEKDEDPSPILSASYDAAAEAPPSPQSTSPGPACPEVRRTEAGLLPAAFFDQPVRTHTVVEDDWLSLISRDLLGDPMNYPVLFLLNGDRIQDADRIFPGQQIHVPTEPRSLESWLEDVPPACRNGRNPR